MESKFINLKKILPLVALLLVSCIYGQVRIANSATNQAAINSSAFIDASSNTAFNQSPTVGKGLLYPRTDLTAFNGFSGVPVGTPNSYPYNYDGFMVFNTAASGTAGVGATEGTLCRGFWYYDNPSNTINGGTWKPLRPCFVTPPTFIFNCEVGKINTGTLTQNTPAASDVTTQFTYENGNSTSYSQIEENSTGVLGLKATLSDGILGSSGTLTFHITGTPSSAGTATFTFTINGVQCSFSRTVEPSGPTVTELLCDPQIDDSVEFTQGIQATAITKLIYHGGNGQYYPQGQEVLSTGVTGLRAKLQSGTLTTGATGGTITFEITGTPDSAGEALFQVSFAGHSCTISRLVKPSAPVIRQARLGYVGSYTTGNSIHSMFGMDNPAYFGSSGIYNKVLGVSTVDAQSALLNQTAQQLKVNFDILSVADTETNNSLIIQKLKDFASLGGVVLVNFTSSQQNSLFTSLGNTGPLQMIPNSANGGTGNSYLSSYFGDTTGAIDILPGFPRASVYSSQLPSNNRVFATDTDGRILVWKPMTRFICFAANFSEVEPQYVHYANTNNFVRNLIAAALDAALGYGSF
ncbi:hypothetical protein D1631_18405 [Chryseobacterium nematophagum]|uniref:Uncharacterized protein n=1 Tax=Chryseobacterium nematophagum TaxID=2305228 RepID=A0A3M7TC24_9FLAO|nr:hypothetical protein [Chryseobacterium nematophagum]RNA60466.1 hypothetical protein D1631_18405 [Chryseobacterium nematophagum]